MKLKRSISCIMLVLTLAVLLFAATSCGEGHEHAFSDWKNVGEPTCTSIGFKSRSCECGYTEYGTIAAVAHTPELDAAYPATCTTPGKTEGSHCKNCGIIITKQTETEKLAHTLSEWKTEVEPTCTSIGFKSRSCECGYTEYGTIAAVAHTPELDAAYPATCTTPGKTEGSHCKNCGAVITAQYTIDATGHSYTDVSIIDEALCNHDGIKRFTCTNRDCSCYYEESYSIPELSGEQIRTNAIQYTGVLYSYDLFGQVINSGSAFVISRDGTILTDADKIDNAFSSVFVLGENEYEVTEVLAYDDKRGLAALKVNATDLPCAPICERSPVNSEIIYMVGAPSNLSNSITSGIISNAKIEKEGICFIQHDTNMLYGYGGGPLINRYGEVIGLNFDSVGGNGISISISICELASLDYSTPMSMSEHYSATYTPTEQLRDWIMLNSMGSKDNSEAYVLMGRDFYYALGYDKLQKISYVDASSSVAGIGDLYVRIDFKDTNGTYAYYALLTDGVRKNEVNGFIDAESYTEDTPLTFDTFYGRYWAESDVMAIYSKAIYKTIGWFSYCLDTYFSTVSLESFKFTSVSYDRDADALGKLNDFVVKNGTLNETTGAHEFVMTSTVGEDPVKLIIAYVPEGESTPASTVAVVERYMANGAVYRVSISLDPTENGNRFDLEYLLHDGTNYVLQNTGWGYLDANSLTNTTPLFCYVFEGLNEYEDGLLMEYMIYLEYLMSWLDYVMPGISPELSVKDLGFLFYIN